MIAVALSTWVIQYRSIYIKIGQVLYKLMIMFLVCCL